MTRRHGDKVKGSADGTLVAMLAVYILVAWIVLTCVAGFAAAAFIVHRSSSSVCEDRMATPELFDSGLPRRETALVARYFLSAQARMKQMVFHPVGTTQSSQAFRQARAAEQIARVDTILRRLKIQTSAWVGKNAPAVFRDAKKRADQQAIDAGVKMDGRLFDGSFSQVDQRTIVLFARDTLADLDKAAESMADRAASVLRQTAQVGLSEADINTVLAGGVIAGKPVETVRTLREALRQVHGDEIEIVGRSGTPMNFKVGYYAEMVARTKTRQATVIARHDRLAELGMDLVAIVGRISNNFCTAFLGQVFSLSGNHPKYPAFAELPGGGPPFHPNCSKSTRPFVEELAGRRQLDQAEGLDDARKLLRMDQAAAQRAFKDLQLHAQQKDRYATTEKQLFGRGSEARG